MWHCWPKIPVLLWLALIGHGEVVEKSEGNLREQSVDKQSDVRISSEYESRARMIMTNGNMHFRVGTLRNITFNVGPEGGIYFGGLNILTLPTPEELSNIRERLATSGLSVAQARVMLAVLQKQVPKLRDDLDQMGTKYVGLQQQLKRLNASRRGYQQRRIRSLLSMLSKQVDKLYRLLKKNECDEGPCANGAICLDLFANYHCLCPSHYTGKNCEKRVDECALYNGTHAGCRNGANCTNNADGPGFSCQCAAGFHGQLCQYTKNVCDADDQDICGTHGHCVPSEPRFSGAAAYRCMCDYGFRPNQDAMNPACVDVDECAEQRLLCFPGVACINLPGSFKCGSCPPGFKGDGKNCQDIDECRGMPCSTDPIVACRNTLGSFECGECPRGYDGDGFNCTKKRFCSKEDYPCNNLSRCMEYPVGACVCPPEYAIGDGRRGTECKRAGWAFSCECRNAGHALRVDDKCQCVCAKGYHGATCEFEDVCYRQPDFCNGNGVCRPVANGAECECARGSADQRCAVDVCDVSAHNATGRHRFVLPSALADTCTLSLEPPHPDQRYRVWVQLESATPANALVGYRSERNRPDDVTFFKSMPTKEHPLISLNGRSHVVVRLRNDSTPANVTVFYEAFRVRCGGRMDAASADFSHVTDRAEGRCEWSLSVPRGVIEVTVQGLRMPTGSEYNCTVNDLSFFDGYLITGSRTLTRYCSSVSEPIVRRFPTRHATLRLTYDTLLADPDQLAQCPLRTKAQNNTLDSPQCLSAFKVTYRAVPLETDCSAVIRSRANEPLEVVVETPNYGHAYPPRTDCLWEVELSDANRTLHNPAINQVQAEFLGFDLAPAAADDDAAKQPGAQPADVLNPFGECGADVLKISTDLSFDLCNMQMVGVFSEQGPPNTLRLNHNDFMRFTSDDKDSGAGIRVRFTGICRYDFDGDRGAVRSPNLKEPAAAAFKCTYHIRPKDGHVIRLKFDYIGLPAYSATCMKMQNAIGEDEPGGRDYIELQGGHEQDAQLNRRYYCARYPFISPKGDMVISGYRGATITYSASGAPNNTGFLFTYAYEDIGCGQVLTLMRAGAGADAAAADHRLIRSPNYPQKYPPHMFCVTHVVSPFHLRLTFEAFDVENVASRSDCGFDAVEVYKDYPPTGPQSLLGRFCGVSLPPPLLIRNSFHVVFTSDRSVNGAGFLARVDVVNTTLDCNRHYTALSGHILFNMSDYFMVQQCEIRITLPAMHRIRLNITDYQVPCATGRVLVKNGAHADSPGFARLGAGSDFCDQRPIPLLVSQGHQLLVVVKMRTGDPAYINMSYTAIENTCGGYITAMSGAISSPQYPNPDSHQLQCTWQIAVAEGNRIRFQVEQLDDLNSVDRHGACTVMPRNHLDVADGNADDNTLLKKFCQQENSPEPVLSAGNQLLVRYNQGGGSINGGLYGFLAQFSTVCRNIVLDQPFGSIQSPGYPHPVDERRQCDWTIRTSPGSRIRVVFHKFQVVGAQHAIRYNGRAGCFANQLAARDDQLERVVGAVEGRTRDDLRTGQFCDEHLVPAELHTRSNQLALSFKSGGNAVVENHFWLSWSTIGCGGHVNQNNSEITALTADFVAANLSATRECVWTVKAPVGFVPEVRVAEVYTLDSLKGDTGCNMNGSVVGNELQFFAGPRVTEHAFSALCGSHGTGEVVRSPSNQLTIRLAMQAKFTNSRNGTVMRATVKFVPLPDGSACGGVIRVKPGQDYVLTSPNFPAPFEPSTECLWQLSTEHGFGLSFNLTHFVNPSKKNWYNLVGRGHLCHAADIFLYGGLTFYLSEYVSKPPHYSGYNIRQRYGEVIRICQNIKEPIVVDSLRNVSTVTFFGAPFEHVLGTDASQPPAVGFRALVRARCGGTVYAAESRRSLSLRPDMVREEGCTFRIQKENDTVTGQKLNLALDLLDMNAFDEETQLFYNVTCDGQKEPGSVSTSRRSMTPIQCESELVIQLGAVPTNTTLTMHYDTIGYMCADVGDAVQGTFEFADDIDCDMDFAVAPGNKLKLELMSGYVPETDDCVQNYVDLREGPQQRLLSRLCGDILQTTYVAEQIHMRLLRKPLETDDVEELIPNPKANIKPWLTFRFEKELGGQTDSKRIQLPADSTRLKPAGPVHWLIEASQPDAHIEIEFLSLAGVTVEVYDFDCAEVECGASIADTALVRWDTLADRTERVVRVAARSASILVRRRAAFSHFDLRWRELGAAERNGSSANGTTSPPAEDAFDCGGTLAPDFAPKNLTLDTSGGRYANNLRCKWTIPRPLMHSLYFTIKLLDIEEHPSCSYDFLSITSRDYNNVKELQQALYINKFCRKDDLGREVLLTQDSDGFIYFISDRSRSFGGFTIEYKLSCETFEYFPAKNGKFAIDLHSPQWPRTGALNLNCSWGVMLETNRDILVRALEMDLAPPRAEDAQCAPENALRLSTIPTSRSDAAMVSDLRTYCGNNLFNYTARYGRVFLSLKVRPGADGTPPRKGVRLHISELTHSCSDTLVLTEENPRDELTSPNYPNSAPNSLDCQYTISAPAGRRVKFTVDPDQFLLQSLYADRCTDDYLEIRDGPSAASPLVGRFCGDHPPSTVVSTDAHLFVRFVTDFYSPSEGWRATYELASCGGVIVLTPNGNTTLTSPNFPNAYMNQGDCEWRVRAPPAHFVEGFVDHLSLLPSANCGQEYLSVVDGPSVIPALNAAANGTQLLAPACNSRAMPQRHFRSAHGALLVRLHANNSLTRGARMFCLGQRCGFALTLRATRFACGGLVEGAEEGELRVPGYPTHVVPGLECVWEFRAGIGARYRFDLDFLDEDNFYQPTYMYLGTLHTRCFPDLSIWNGPPAMRFGLFSSYQRFCANRTAFLSTADLVTVAFEEQRSGSAARRDPPAARFNRPFRLRYQRVDADVDDGACMHHVTDDANLTIADLEVDNVAALTELDNRGRKSFCHIRVDNPSRQTTVALHFADFRAGRSNLKVCTEQSNHVVITDSASGVWPVQEVLCNGVVSNGTFHGVYNVPVLDILVNNNPFTLVKAFDNTVQFNLSVVYHACGGVITEDDNGNFGTIKAPGTESGGNYTDNTDCLWTFQAPKGQVVKVTIKRMDLQYEVGCNHDVLIISEGPELHSVLHRLCNSESVEAWQLQDRFKHYLTRDRFLTMHFHSDERVNGRGFELDWEFVQPDANATCGFHTHALSGEIHSPGYPLAPYPNNLKCMWEINVPAGFHVRLSFDHLDIAKSADCQRDYLLITQEHQSRGKDPLRDYLFYYDHDEPIGRVCGIDHAPPLESESGKVRVHFETDASVAGRGFRLTWEARCGGATFRTNHGEVMSPFYPRHYPNADAECSYVIDPETSYTQIVTLRLDDLDLDDTIADARRQPCASDYVQIIDVAANRVAYTACGREPAGRLISIKGPVGVRFVTNTSFLHDVEKRIKNQRGFHLTYALSDCGGEVRLGDELNHLTGLITSPGYPLPYHHKLDCLWNITAPEGHVVAIKFRNINIEPSELCYFDYVELFDGTEMSNTTSWGRLCGDGLPSGTRMTRSNSLLLRFHTDENSSKDGFDAVVTATLGEDRGCGGDLKATADWQQITPPANGNYLNNLRCWWRVAGETGRVVEFRLKHAELEEKKRNGQCYDFLAIYDGPKSISPFLLPPSCTKTELDTTQRPLHYYSSFKSADVYFETDYSEGAAGFLLEYRTVEPDCGGVFTADSTPRILAYESRQTLTRTHQRYKRCRFFVRGAANEPVQLSVNAFSFPSRTAKCEQEFFEVSDVGQVAECQHPACADQQRDARNTYRSCGTDVFWRFVSRTSLVQISTSVLLQSEFASRFNLTYQILDSCNRTITVDEPYSRWAAGRVHSPNFPNEYDANSTCVTDIVVPDEYHVLLVFGQFSVERGLHHVRRLPYWRRFPGRVGLLDYRPSRLRRFADFGDCRFDKLTITFNFTANATRPSSTHCGFVPPAPVLSAQNRLRLQFVTDASNAHGGYEAFYYLVKEYRQQYRVLYEYATSYEKSGVVNNVGYPGHEQNATYRVTITPPRGNRCQLVVTRMLNKQYGGDCNEGDTLKVGFVRSDGEPLWRTLTCAHELKKTVVMDTFYLDQVPTISYKLELTTDDDAANDGPGFQASWTCHDEVTPQLVADEWDTKRVD